MSETTHQPIWDRCGDSTPLDRQNLVRLFAAMVGWAISLSIASQAIKREWLPEGLLLFTVAALPTLAGIVVLATYARLVSGLDELQKVLHLEALALAFGGAMFAYFGYQVFERIGAPPATFEAYTVVWMVIVFVKSIRDWRHFR